MPNMVDQAPNTTVTRSVVYGTVDDDNPQRESWMRAMRPAIRGYDTLTGIARDIFMPPR